MNIPTYAKFSFELKQKSLIICW